MIKCTRCGRDVDTLQNISPERISKELVEAMDHGEEDLAGKGDMEVCAECVDELREE